MPSAAMQPKSEEGALHRKYRSFERQTGQERKVPIKFSRIRPSLVFYVIFSYHKNLRLN